MTFLKPSVPHPNLITISSSETTATYVNLLQGQGMP